MLPIEQATMPAEDVSDLREVVDAINKLCETMKNSYEENYEDCSEVADNFELNPSDNIESLEYMAENFDSRSTAPTEYTDSVSNSMDDLDTRWYYPTNSDSELKDPIENLDAIWSEPAEMVSNLADNLDSSWSNQTGQDSKAEEPLVNPTEVVVKKIETHVAERWSDPVIDDAEAIVSDTENMMPHCEPISEMYYTASSEVSLLSETDFVEKLQGEDSDREKDDRQSVMAGHVAAMRERFESMTRANTPCPDLIRSLSPSLDVFRNVTPSPDFLDRS